MIEKIVTLSNAHVPPDAIEDSDWGPFRMSEHEHGWILFTFADAKSVPKWLGPIYDYAQKNHCVAIMFDRDASTSDRFEAYDW